MDVEKVREAGFELPLVSVFKVGPEGSVVLGAGSLMKAVFKFRWRAAQRIG